MGPFSDSSSKATSKEINVSDQAQYNEKSQVIQSGSKGAVGKGAKFMEAGAVDLTKARITGDTYKNKGDVNIGLNEGDVASLLETTTANLGAQISGAASQTSGIVAQMSEQTSGILASLTGLLGQKSEGETGQPKLLTWVAIAAVLGFVIVFLWRK